MVKVTKNPNDIVGRSRLVPGRKKTARKQQEEKLKMVSFRIPKELESDLAWALSTINSDRRRISKQDYITHLMSKALSDDLEKLRAGEKIDL